MTDKKLDNSANDQDENLETELGNLVKIDSQAFQNWLEANNSFKFVAGVGGCHSYRARKEALRGVNYWYAVKRVNGTLHKKFIGKSHEVTHSRLCEIANVIMQPPKTRVAAVSNESSTPGLEDRVKQLELIVNQLRGLDTVGETETLLDVEYLPSEELEADKQKLTNQVNELTIKLDICDRELEALNQDNTKLTTELSSRDSQLTELTTKLDTRDRELRELTNEIVNLKSRLSELDNSVVNKNSELQELKSVPPAATDDQLPVDNDQQGTGNREQGIVEHEDVGQADSDLTSDTKSPMTNDQLPLWDNKLMKNPVDSVRKQLKNNKITKTAEEIKQAFLNAGFDGTNYKDLREDVIKTLSQK
ncbi:MAG: hypothetical protein AN485_07505 [Anabaena sp. MDT14b]|jgi:chromosome segregation ATPase|nr:MAG: hypothetical protein AN485_07505 [Anabaena sp. MDT14b]